MKRIFSQKFFPDFQPMSLKEKFFLNLGHYVCLKPSVRMLRIGLQRPMANTGIPRRRAS